MRGDSTRVVTRTHRVAAALCGLLVATQPACTALWLTSGHDARGDLCQPSAVPGIFDLIIGAGLGLGMATGGVFEKSRWWGLIPATFAVTGTIGTIASYHCRHSAERGGTARRATLDDIYRAQPPLPQVPDAAPTDDDADAAPVPVPVIAPVPPPAGEEHGLACRLHPLTACPDGQSCLVTSGSQGECVPDDGPPGTTPVQPHTELPQP